MLNFLQTSQLLIVNLKTKSKKFSELWPGPYFLNKDVCFPQRWDNEEKFPIVFYFLFER